MTVVLVGEKRERERERERGVGGGKGGGTKKVQLLGG
jgi:hypothetical protein